MSESRFIPGGTLTVLTPDEKPVWDRIADRMALRFKKQEEDRIQIPYLQLPDGDNALPNEPKGAEYLISTFYSHLSEENKKTAAESITMVEVEQLDQLVQDLESPISLRELNAKYELGLSEVILAEADH
ncbi:MAG: hypothetical protein UU65_C0002G0234 [candidate division CPR2 bacterium GW2011_GWC1_41_48]|uniref:Uncharacterized protein n=1 Tax=candidate division CPR2 bacterium GW2011_GWC1_41_48 TaxID=1618344 RepID=A0A0G0YIS3_UNCC2|nr:MAG: hypothetical protein UT47_C0002G0070 [candidate division CPR2 bacterium GW2011_GWC2_39_35]KKR28933.1 MAG: hypothetical protein UT59_C0015G0012 [candidate division CPR2 bacterium GW2011_GWD1_39_7]KKR28959.1 MAG: hypothetical protein UT60_C0008G0002 [candidate division CPR2 bacterium GW2011_GWD2_39_7]KKS09456.1 MAG: hypothetical protein UU65_C0002G0234 [candidate division CPR2 bacterium GW2011_GWC1_41_48]OGB61760.1 MAG: hypothetical protein A2Y27_02265 [candidate division CPR2 bacterium G